MELHARQARAVLVRRESGTEHELDPSDLALPAGLASDLHEWASVAEAVQRSAASPDPDDPGPSPASQVSQRGRQLAGRLAAAVGAGVTYVDPAYGGVELVLVPDPLQVPVPLPAGLAAQPAGAAPSREPAEPTPWGTGLTVSAFTAVVVFVAVLTLSQGLNVASTLLAIAANVVIAGGLAPSVWLARNIPVWRWVAFGVIAGLGSAWVALLVALVVS